MNPFINLMVGILGAINLLIGAFMDNYSLYSFGMGILIANIIFIIVDVEEI